MSPGPRPRPLLALLIRLAAVAILSSMGAMIKLAHSRGVAFMEIMFWRQFVTIPMLLVWAMLAGGGLKTLATGHPKMHAKRAIFGMSGMILGLGAVVLLPLAEATTLNFTVPMFAVLLSIFVYKEAVGVWRWSAVALGFVGILIITQPGNSHIPLFGAAVGLVGAVMIALTMFQIAELSKLDKPMVIVFWFAVISSPIYLLFVPFTHTPYGGFEMLLLLAIGVTGAFGQILLTAALRFGSVASVIVMDYSALFWATLFGWFLFDHLPPASTWLGAPLIVMAGLVIAWREHRLSRSKPTSATPH